MNTQWLESSSMSPAPPPGACTLQGGLAVFDLYACEEARTASAHDPHDKTHEDTARQISQSSDRSDAAEPANCAKVSARVLTPFSMSPGDAYSSGLWLQPFLQGMKIIPAGAICAMNKES